MQQLEHALFPKLKEILLTQDLEFQVRSPSMEPLIKIDDVIKVKKIDRTLNRFDIIVFKSQIPQDKKIYVHYVWRIIHQGTDKEIIITKGLNNPSKDVPITKEFVLGIVTNFSLSTAHKYSQVLKLWFKRKFSNEN